MLIFQYLIKGFSKNVIEICRHNYYESFKYKFEKNKNKYNFIKYSAIYGNFNIIKYLLKSLDYNDESDIVDIFYQACRYNYYNIIEFLIYNNYILNYYIIENAIYIAKLHKCYNSINILIKIEKYIN